MEYEIKGKGFSSFMNIVWIDEKLTDNYTAVVHFPSTSNSRGWNSIVPAVTRVDFINPAAWVEFSFSN